MAIRPMILCEHQEREGIQFPGCGAEIMLVTVIPEILTQGRPRKKIPLNAAFDPTLGIPPSHALMPGGATCYPLRPGERPAPGEKPALTHFATCPYRRTS